MIGKEWPFHSLCIRDGECETSKVEVFNGAPTLQSYKSKPSFLTLLIPSLHSKTQSHATCLPPQLVQCCQPPLSKKIKKRISFPRFCWLWECIVFLTLILQVIWESQPALKMATLAPRSRKQLCFYFHSFWSEESPRSQRYLRPGQRVLRKTGVIKVTPIRPLATLGTQWAVARSNFFHLRPAKSQHPFLSGATQRSLSLICSKALWLGLVWQATPSANALQMATLLGHLFNRTRWCEQVTPEFPCLHWLPIHFWMDGIL